MKLFLIALLFTKEEMDLKKMEEILLSSNLQLRIQEADVSFSMAKLENLRLKKFVPKLEFLFLTGPVPEAKGDIMHPEDKTGDIEGLGPFFKVKVDLYQPIYTFGRFRWAERAAEWGVSASREKLNALRNELLKRLRLAYLGYLLFSELHSFTEELENAYDKVYEKARKTLDKGGNVTESDILRLEMFGEKLRAQKAELNMTKTNLVATISTLLSSESISPQTLPLSVVEFEDRGMDFYIKKGLEERAEIKAVEAGIESLRTKIKAIRTKYFPVFFFGGTFGYGYAPNRTPQTNPWANEEFNYTVIGGVIGVKEDLDFHHVAKEVEEAEAELQKAEAELNALKSGINLEIRTSYEKTKNLAEKLKRLDAAYSKSRSLFLSTLLNYEMGLVEVEDVLDRFGDYIEARTEFLKAVFSYDQAVVELFHSAGIPQEFPGIKSD